MAGTTARQMNETGRASRIGWRAGSLYALLPLAVALALDWPAYPPHVPQHVMISAMTELDRAHLADSIIALLAVLLGIGCDPSTSLRAATWVFGPACLAALGLAAAWAAAPLAARGWRWLAPVAIGLYPLIGIPAGPGASGADLAVVLAGTMTAGWAVRVIAGVADGNAGWPLGAWAAVGLWLSPVSLPLTIMIFGGLWIAWLAGPRGDAIVAAARNAGATFLLTAFLALLADPPEGGVAIPDPNRLSLLYVMLAAAVAEAAVGIGVIHQTIKATAERAVVSLLFCTLAALGWFGLFPDLSVAALVPSDGIGAAIAWRRFLDPGPVDLDGAGAGLLLSLAVIVGSLACFAVEQRSSVLAYVMLCTGLVFCLRQSALAFPPAIEALAAILLPVVLTRLGRQRLAGAAVLQPAPR
ncbi:MAG: hypothetical protein AB7F35_24135, partial [Acetobacteraceae bacterium]